MDYEFRRHQLEQEIQQAKNSLQNAPEKRTKGYIDQNQGPITGSFEYNESSITPNSNSERSHDSIHSQSQ